MFSSMIEEGTKTKPYIIQVDIHHPERNREFDILRVGGIIHNGYTRNGFHIRRSIAVPDHELWEATIPQNLPSYEKRAVLIKGPSRDFSIRDSDRYHRKMACNATKNAHMATEIKIEDDLGLQSSFWLLLFPEGIILDNAFVETGWVKMIEHNSPIGEPLHGMAVYWVIGET